MTEDFRPVAAVGTKVAANTDDARTGNIDCQEHVESLAGIRKGDVLRRRNNENARQGHPLRHG